MSTQANAGLLRGLRILEAVSGAGSIGSRELAKQLGEDHARVQRLLKSLRTEGYVQQGPDRKYVPGPAIHLVSARCFGTSPLLRAALAVLRPLHAEGHHMALGLLKNQEVCYLFHGSPELPFEAGLGAVLSYPAAESSIGRILSDPDHRNFAFHKPKKGLGSFAVPILQHDQPIAGLACLGEDEHRCVPLLQAAALRISNTLTQQNL
jgi:DNA-binding IclR family transcriptional regulator